MILSEIKHYIMGRKQVSPRDIAIHFGTDPDVMKDMLGHLVRYGRVTKIEYLECSGFSYCKGYNKPDRDIYNWNT